MSSTEWKSDDMIDAAVFYDALAPSYDRMTGFETRLERSLVELGPLVRKYGITTGVDMGCGSGVITLALERLKVQCMGIDISPLMVKTARENASRLNMESRFQTGDFLSGEVVRNGPPDAVFCLGNAMPHVRDAVQLQEVLDFWKSRLIPGGRVFLQLLNYERILLERERIVAVRKTSDGYLIRFYDFTSPRITFNLLQITERETVPSHDLRSTLLFPVLRSTIRDAADRAGFRNSTFHSDLLFTPFSEDSRDLVAVLS